MTPFTITVTCEMIQPSLGTTGNPGPTGFPCPQGSAGFQGSTGVTGQPGFLGSPSFGFSSVRFTVTSACHKRAKKLLLRSYYIQRSHDDDKDFGTVDVTSFIDILGFRLFTRRSDFTNVPLVAVLVFEECPA